MLGAEGDLIQRVGSNQEPNASPEPRGRAAWRSWTAAASSKSCASFSNRPAAEPSCSIAASRLQSFASRCANDPTLLVELPSMCPSHLREECFAQAY